LSYKYYFVVTQDHVILSNTSGTSDGILVVGQASPPMTYKSFTSTTGSFTLGQVTLAKSNNEVVAFTNQRAVAIQTPVAWTTGSDTVNLALSGPIDIDVTVWIVTGPYQAQHDRAVAMSIAASSIWDNERMGVAFGTIDFHDATDNPSAPLYSNFSDCNMKISMQAAIGKDPGRINVYMVGLVQGIVGRGQACGVGSDFVAMSAGAGDALLAHEIGHDFGLEHIDTLVGDFDQTNVMYSASDVRQYFTEGQLFRAHLAPLSALNAVYPDRKGQPQRYCAQAASDSLCPPIAKRIWADGTFLPN
jgi:hypothetical protein